MPMVSNLNGRGRVPIRPVGIGTPNVNNFRPTLNDIALNGNYGSQGGNFTAVKKKPTNNYVSPQGGKVYNLNKLSDVVAYNQSIGVKLNQQQTPGQTLTDSYTQAYNDAKSANEARYSEILGDYGNLSKGFTDRLNTSMGLLKNAGTAQAAGIKSDYADLQSQEMQNLVDSGFYNGTVMSSTKTGVEAKKQVALNDLAESVRQQKLSTYGQLSGDMLNSQNNMINFKNSREDTYPDLNMYAQLMQQYGASNSEGGSSSSTSNRSSSSGTGNSIRIRSGDHIGFRRPSKMPKLKTRNTRIG
jgi:hypothetical protein